MIPIFIIVTTLVTTAPVKGAMECHLSDTGIDQQCVGALGEPLNFNLPTSANKQIILTKNNVQILRIANNTLKESESTYRDHASFFEHNGTFKIQSVRKSDAGDYTLETHGLTDGVFLHKTTIHLKIQVSQPVVSQVCLSPEQMRVSCSSEGDGVEFTLTLDSNFLIKTRETRAGSTDNDHMPSVTIKLNGQLTGTLTCIVNNNVSREETSLHLTSCSASICHFIVAVRAVVVALLLLVLCLAVYHVQKKSRL